MSDFKVEGLIMLMSENNEIRTVIKPKFYKNITLNYFLIVSYPFLIQLMPRIKILTREIEYEKVQINVLLCHETMN